MFLIFPCVTEDEPCMSILFRDLFMINLKYGISEIRILSPHAYRMVEKIKT